MKKLLLLGLVVSATAMADVVELRVGSDLAHNGKFKGGQYSGSNVKLKKKSTRNGFELAGEYRKSLTDTWELGGESLTDLIEFLKKVLKKKDYIKYLYTLLQDIILKIHLK